MPISDDALSSFNDASSWRAVRVRRLIVLLAAFGMIAGTGLITAGFAMAASTLEPGNLTISPSTGPVSTQPTWSTTDACPANFQGSAAVAEFNTTGSFASRISNVVPAPAAPIHNATFQGQIGDMLSTTNITEGGTVAFAVGCYSGSGGTGNVEYVQLTFIKLSSDGTTYSTASTGPTPTFSPTSTTTSTTSSTASSTASSTTSDTSSSTSSTTSDTASSTASSTTTAPAASSTLPSGGPQTGAGGAALPSGGNNVLIALGALALAGSAAAMGLAMVRRPRKLAQENGQGGDTPGAS